MSLTPLPQVASPLSPAPLLTAIPFRCLHLWVCFRRVFFFFSSWCQTLVMKSPVMGSDVGCRSALGKRLYFSMTASLKQKKDSSPILTHRVESPRISHSQGKKDLERRRPFGCYFYAPEFLSQANISHCFLDLLPWGRRLTGKAWALLIYCCLCRVGCRRGTHSRRHLKVLLLYSHLGNLTL